MCVSRARGAACRLTGRTVATTRRQVWIRRRQAGTNITLLSLSRSAPSPPAGLLTAIASSTCPPFTHTTPSSPCGSEGQCLQQQQQQRARAQRRRTARWTPCRRQGARQEWQRQARRACGSAAAGRRGPDQQQNTHSFLVTLETVLAQGSVGYAPAWCEIPSGLSSGSSSRVAAA